MAAEDSLEINLILDEDGRTAPPATQGEMAGQGAKASLNVVRSPGIGSASTTTFWFSQFPLCSLVDRKLCPWNLLHSASVRMRCPS